MCRYFHCKYDFQLKIYHPENLGRFIFSNFLWHFREPKRFHLAQRIEKLQYTFKSSSLSLALIGSKARGALELRASHLPEAQSERFSIGLHLFNPLTWIRVLVNYNWTDDTLLPHSPCLYFVPLEYDWRR